tara:strand:+ start:34374 stop:35027 length:654 start_codon:yes stop_codon:yes gene_type:complete
MLAGHYAPALFIKARYPSLKLWVLFLAVQVVDIFFFIFALAGIEEMTVLDVRGPLGLHLEHVPFTHSLLMNLGFGACCVLWGAIAKRWKHGLLIGVALCSHWALDLVVHLPDLPLAPWGGERVGFGFWELVYSSLIVEILILTAAYFFFRKTIQAATTRRFADVGMAALVFVQLSYVFGPRMPSVLTMAAMAEFIYFGFIWYAYQVDRRLARPDLGA